MKVSDGHKIPNMEMIALLYETLVPALNTKVTPDTRMETITVKPVCLLWIDPVLAAAHTFVAGHSLLPGAHRALGPLSGGVQGPWLRTDLAWLGLLERGWDGRTGSPRGHLHSWAPGPGCPLTFLRLRLYSETLVYNVGKKKNTVWRGK